MKFGFYQFLFLELVLDGLFCTSQRNIFRVWFICSLAFFAISIVMKRHIEFILTVGVDDTTGDRSRITIIIRAHSTLER